MNKAGVYGGIRKSSMDKAESTWVQVLLWELSRHFTEEPVAAGDGSQLPGSELGVWRKMHSVVRTTSTLKNHTVMENLQFQKVYWQTKGIS